MSELTNLIFENLNSLPSEMIAKILNYLNYDQLLIIRKKDEKFSGLVDYVISLNVVWTGSDYHSIYPDQILNKFIYRDYCLISNSSTKFKNNPDTYQKIRKLFIFDLDFLPDVINFENLIYLHINQNEKSLNKSKLILNAPNLNFMTIYIEKSEDLDFILTLKTINLKYFETDLNLNKFEFIHPESLENLIFVYGNSNLPNLDTGIIINNIAIRSLKKFINLKLLDCWTFDNEDVNNYNLFKELIHLKKFTLNKFTRPIQLSEFFNRIKLLNNNLEIFYHGIQLNSIDNFENLHNLPNADDDDVFSDLELGIYKNYIDHLLDNLNYLELYISKLDDLPLKIIQKLVNVETLYINNNIKDDNKLIQILQIIKPARIIIENLVDQRILNLINQFNSLNIIEFSVEDFRDINFILNMRNLMYLECGKFFDFNLFKLIIKNLKYLKSIGFDNIFTIEFNINKIKILKDDIIISEENRNEFINNKINLLNDWSDLFRLDEK